MPLKLVLANKAYSSWSLRPWILLAHFKIPFEEIVIPMGSLEEMLKYAPTGKCPSLHDGRIAVWESLAIIEYVAELYPEKAIWPRGKAARAHARSLANEMHAGFLPLRQACPTNFRRAPKAIALSDAVKNDIARIEAAWAHARETYGKARTFPVRPVFRRRCDVRPGGEPLSCLRSPGRAGDANLYGCGDGASGLEGLDRGRRGGALADRRVRGRLSPPTR